jgi:type VII secretion system (Wss) protein YukD
MSTRMTPRMIQVTFRYPDGSARLAAPADVPLGELMPDFLDLAGQSDGDGRVLSADGVHAYPGERTLAELRVLDGGVLVLHRHSDGLPSAAPTGPEVRSAPAAPWPTGPRSGGEEQPLRERTDRTLPPKLSRPERSRLALAALAGGRARADAPEPALSSVPGPRTFTRPARSSPMARVHEVWRSTDYQHHLDELILALRLRRSATIAVISPKGGVFSRVFQRSPLRCLASLTDCQRTVRRGGHASVGQSRRTKKTNCVAGETSSPRGERAVGGNDGARLRAAGARAATCRATCRALSLSPRLSGGGGEHRDLAPLGR